MRPYLLLIAALGAMACNPSDPYCDPATPCVGDNEICNFALRRCEKKSDSGAPDGPIADVTPDTPKPDAPLPDAPPPDAPQPDAPLSDAPLPDAPAPDAPRDGLAAEASAP